MQDKYTFDIRMTLSSESNDGGDPTELTEIASMHIRYQNISYETLLRIEERFIVQPMTGMIFELSVK